MNDTELIFDRSCHVLYSDACKAQIQARIRQHYPPDKQEEVWTRVQQQYAAYLRDWRTDLGGKANFHNGAGGTYDSIALMTYYAVCREVTSLAEVEEMLNAILLPSFRKLGFANANHPLVRRLMHLAFRNAEKQCSKWHDYVMRVAPYAPGQPIYYEFTACPVAEFAKQFGLLDVMPAICNPDYAAMEFLHARLVRTTTCANGEKCDYTICGDRDAYLDAHPEYVDAQGYRRNR